MSKVDYICRTCGSNNVRHDAWVVWNVDTQRMQIFEVYDNTWCDDCEAECTVDEVPIDDTI